MNLDAAFEAAPPVEVVDADDFIASVEQCFGDVHADEAGGACY